jgi:cofilin
MMYASSKDAIRKQLVGISAEIQATSFDEITFESGMHLFRALFFGSL